MCGFLQPTRGFRGVRLPRDARVSFKSPLPTCGEGASRSRSVVPMSEVLPPSPPGDPSPADRPLADRVLARVHEASIGVGHRRQLRGRSRSLDHETRSLVKVFRDLGDVYRAHRRRTGDPVSADVRAAATRFRKERNVMTLVAVAGSLDRLQILPW